MERARLGLVDLLRGFSPCFEILPCTCQRGGQEATLAADNKTTSVCAHAMCDPAGDRCQAVYVRTARGEAGRSGRQVGQTRVCARDGWEAHVSLCGGGSEQRYGGGDAACQGVQTCVPNGFAYRGHMCAHVSPKTTPRVSK